MAKSMINFVVDVSQTMAGPVRDSGGASKFDLARAFVIGFATKKQVGKVLKTFEMGVIACGSDGTRNALNDNPDIGGYDNIEVLLPVDVLSATSLSTLDAALPGVSSQPQSSITDGVIVASDIAIKTKEKLKYTRMIVLITDGEAAISGDDMEAWDSNIVPSMVAGDKEAKKNVILHVILLGHATGNPNASLTKRENAKMLAGAARSTGGDFIEASSLADCYWLLSFGPGLGTNPVSSKVLLELAPGVQLPCGLWKLASKETLPTIKKKRKLSLDDMRDQFDAAADNDAAAGGEDEGNGEAMEVTDGFGGGGFGDVLRDSHIRHPHDADQDIAALDKCKGYKYGSQYIPVSGADEGQMLVQGTAHTITVIGTVPADTVKRHHFMEETKVLQGHANVDAAQVGVCALATALRSTGMVALARRVGSKENSDPELVALLPPAEDNGTLVVQRIPCKDELLFFSFPRTPAVPSTEAMDAMARLVDASTFIPGQTSLSSSEMVSSAVSAASLSSGRAMADRLLTSVNPAYYAVLSALTSRLLGREGGSGVNGTGACSVTLASTAVIPQPAEARKALSVLRELLPLTVNEAAGSEKKKVVFFSDILPSNGGSGSAAAVGGLSSAASLTEPAPELSLGSTTPVEDLHAASSHAQSTQESRRAALGVMGAVALGLIDGANTSYYRRAVECLIALRAAAHREAGGSSMFNTLLRDRVLPLFAAGRHAELLQLLQEKGTLPFTALECPSEEDVTVTAQQAADFWTNAAGEGDNLPGAAAGSSGAGGLVSQRPAVSDSLFEDLM